MDPVQFMMTVCQVDAAVAAQTLDQALRAAIVQGRPNLQASLLTNPAAYPDLLGWLASTGNVEVLANLHMRGHLTSDAAANAADGVGDAGTAIAVDNTAGELIVNPAFSQGDPAQVEPIESVESAGGDGTPVDKDGAADEPRSVDGDEAEGIAGADFGEPGDNQDAEEPVEGPDVVEDAQVTESTTEAVTGPNAGTATGETRKPCPDDSGDEVEDGAEDAGSGEAGVEPEIERPAEHLKSTEEAETKGPTPGDPLVENTVADGRSAEPIEVAEEPGTDESDGDSEDVEGDEVEGPAPKDPRVENSGVIEGTADGGPDEAGAKPETKESAEDSKGTERAENATEPDAEPEAVDEVATDADEVQESGADRPEDEASEEQVAEETTVNRSADERGVEPVDAVEESGTGKPVENSNTAGVAIKSNAETATNEATDPNNNDTAVLATASQRRKIDSVDAADVMASTQSATVTSGWTAGSATSATSLAKSVAFLAPLPPSTEDIVTWIGTLSGAPSGFSVAQPAVELGMFGLQTVTQMPPLQRK